MIQRTLYYWSKLYEEQMGEGDLYKKLNRTICINILNFKYLENERFHNVYRLKEIETNEELTDIEEIHFIEIPKLRHLDLKDEADMLELWIEFLRNPESEVIRNVEMKNKEVRKAKDKLYKISQNEKERERYFIRERAIKDEASALYNAEQRGIQKTKIDTILKLYSKNMSENQISDILDIPFDEVEKIIEENK